MNKNWLPVFFLIGMTGCIINSSFAIVGLLPYRGQATMPIVFTMVICNVLGLVGCGIALGSEKK